MCDSNAELDSNRPSGALRSYAYLSDTNYSAKAVDLQPWGGLI
ncbi:MAG: hypothetical protein ACLUYV_03900 [Alistipes shahii]